MRVLLTRPAEDSARIAERLAGSGVECLVWPLTRIVPLAGCIAVPAGTEALLFTSASAVRVFAAGSAARGLPVLAVGDRTAAMAREAGFGQVVSARGDARDLARLARATPHRRFLHPRGREAAGDLAGMLEAAGLSVAAPVIYAAEPAGPPPAEVSAAFAAGALDIVTIWSPRNAAILGDWLAGAAPPLRPPLGTTDLLGISENAVAPLRDAGFRRVVVADRPDAGAMVAWISAALRH